MLTKTERQILKEARDIRKRRKIHLRESMKNFTRAGIPERLASAALQKFDIKHDSVVEPVDKPRRVADLRRGQVLFYVAPNGDAAAIGPAEYAFSSGNWFWIFRYFADEDRLIEDRAENFRDAIKGLSKRGEFFRVKASYWAERGLFRQEKTYEPDEWDVLAGGKKGVMDGGIYVYMNDVFMPRISKKLDKIIDDIYGSLRRLSTTVDKYGDRRRPNQYSFESQQQYAIALVASLEKIQERGFNRETMEKFLEVLGRRHRGFGEIPANERELFDVLRNEPAARAKWANVIIQEANRIRRQFQELLDRADGQI